MNILFRTAATLVMALAASVPAHATIATYTSRADFLTAVGTIGVDSYNDLALGYGPSTYTRMAGSFNYVASVVDRGGAPGAFFNSGMTGDTWLSTDTGIERIVFSGFANNARAVGANVFGVNNDGAFFANQPLIVTLTDFGGSMTQTLLGASIGSFLGFTTTSNIVSLTVELAADSSPFAYPAINDLTLALAVPEPGSYALFAAGIGALALFSRRRGTPEVRDGPRRARRSGAVQFFVFGLRTYPAK